jgi:AcrR family transcriptional regulator
VRDVAARAGVNHGLVHRYFGGKDELVTAAIRSISSDVHRAGPGGAMSASSFAFLREHPELVQLVARACLDGPAELLAIAAPSPDRLETITDQLRAALERVRMDKMIDAHLANAFATAALLGWFTFRPLLRRGFGIPPDADDQLAKLLATLDRFVVATPHAQTRTKKV